MNILQAADELAPADRSARLALLLTFAGSVLAFILADEFFAPLWLKQYAGLANGVSALVFFTAMGSLGGYLAYLRDGRRQVADGAVKTIIVICLGVFVIPMIFCLLVYCLR